MTDVAQLTLVPKGHPVEIDLSDVSKQQTGNAVIALCATKSGLLDKVIAADVGLQEAVWSRAKTGGAHLSLESLIALMQRCGNEAPLHWLLLRMNYDPRSLRQLEDEKDRKIRERDERIAKLEQELETTISVVRRVRPA